MDTPDIHFSSTMFLTADDMALWDSLSPEEQRSIIARDEETGFQSGPAPKEPLSKRLARVRGTAARAV